MTGSETVCVAWRRSVRYQSAVVALQGIAGFVRDLRELALFDLLLKNGRQNDRSCSAVGHLPQRLGRERQWAGADDDWRAEREAQISALQRGGHGTASFDLVRAANGGCELRATARREAVEIVS